MRRVLKKHQGKELSMRKIREILRLREECSMTQQQIAHSCNISQSSVSKFLHEAVAAGLSYEEACKLDDNGLSARMKIRAKVCVKKDYPDVNFEEIHQELRKKGVTLHLLFEEYQAKHPDGYQRSQFYHHYRQWKKKLNPSMRQSHKAGEKLFVDYAGQTIAVYNPKNGQVRHAQIFVAVLGCSNYTYAEATFSQSLPDWINSHIRAFEFFGGVPQVVVPDNLKSAVSKTCLYEPDINPTYHELAVHYATVIMPARVRRPKDKAKAEVGVQIVERWILAALRNRQFFSLEELNRAISKLLVGLNQRAFKKLPGNRQQWFESLESPQLSPLPQRRFPFAQWKKARVNIDYHVELNRHYYSVPCQLLKEEVSVRYCSESVEIFHGGKRVASHLRDDSPGQHSTQAEHMPKSHREYMDWPPSRIIKWAADVGENTKQLVQGIIDSKKYPPQGYRSSLGIMRLSKLYPNNRLEAACEKALLLGAYSYGRVRSILEKGLDNIVLETSPTPGIDHENIRGKSYYQLNAQR